MSTNLKGLADQFNEIQHRIQEDLKGALEVAFKDFFAKYEGVEAVSWTQYTPHFNDGEPCVFGINEFELLFNNTDALHACLKKKDWEGNELTYTQERLDELLEEYLDSWEANTDTPVFEDLKEIESAVQDLDKLIAALLGDGIRVSVTREGIETDWYDHD